MPFFAAVIPRLMFRFPFPYVSKECVSLMLSIKHGAIKLVHSDIVPIPQSSYNMYLNWVSHTLKCTKFAFLSLPSENLF